MTIEWVYRVGVSRAKMTATKAAKRDTWWDIKIQLPVFSYHAQPRLTGMNEEYVRKALVRIKRLIHPDSETATLTRYPSHDWP